MKKTYEKPQIYMERFELAEHIASGCGMIIELRDRNCFDKIEPELFTNEFACQTIDGDNESGCYYAHTSGLFTS